MLHATVKRLPSVDELTTLSSAQLAELVYMQAQTIHRGSYFVVVHMTVIDSFDRRTVDVPERSLRDVIWDLDLREPSASRAAQIVRREHRNRIVSEELPMVPKSTAQVLVADRFPAGCGKHDVGLIRE